LIDIYLKEENQSLFIPNPTGEPEIVLIFPITRNVSESPEKWKAVLDLFEKSEINTIVVIDKTEQSLATDFFTKNFKVIDKRLIVLPRSIKDTLFDTVGEITLGKKMWITQLHDDDNWAGKVALPISPDFQTVYYSDFYLHSESNGLTKFHDFSMPNRIVFSLVPSIIWNKFAELIQAQNCHVPGSFDFTFSLMAKLVCNFEYIPGFRYEWKDNNWSSGRISKSQLIGLAERDGWSSWSSPEIANFNRSVDSLVALNYLDDLVVAKTLNLEIAQLLDTFQPSTKKRIKHLSLTLLLGGGRLFRKIFSLLNKRDPLVAKSDHQLELHRFIIKTWNIRAVSDLISLITELQSNRDFESLQKRFEFWEVSLNDLEWRAISGK